MSQAGSYFSRLKNTLEGVVVHLTTKGIERHHLAFGGEGIIRTRHRYPDVRCGASRHGTGTPRCVCGPAGWRL